MNFISFCLFLFLISPQSFAQDEGRVLSLQEKRRREILHPFLGVYKTSSGGYSVITSIGLEEGKLAANTLWRGIVTSSFEFPADLKPQQLEYSQQGMKHLETIEFAVSRYHLSALIVQRHLFRRQVTQHTIELSADGSTMSHEYQFHLYRRKHWLWGPWVLDTSSNGKRYATQRVDNYIKVSNQPMTKEVLIEAGKNSPDNWFTEGVRPEQKALIEQQKKVSEAVRTGQIISFQDYKNRCSVLFKKHTD